MEDQNKAAPLEAGEIDLEKEREDRCYPVVRGVLTDMATDLLPQAGAEQNYTPLLTKILGRSLEANLNLQMENPFVFQTLLGIVVGLNTTVIECTTAPIDDARYGAIGKKILSIVSTADIRLGTLTPEETTATFVPVKEQLNELFAAEKLSWMEVKYIMDSILAAIKEVEQRFTVSIDQSLQKAEAKAMGVQDMNDLTMQHLDKFLKAPISTEGQ